MATQHVTLHFSRFDSSNVTILNDTNPVGQDTTNDQLYAQIICDDAPGSESYGFWQLEGSSIPSDAYNISINNVQARCAVIGLNDPNDIETYVQLYEDINTPNGDPSNNPFPIDPQGGNVPIDNPGTWTLSQIRTFYMKVCGNNHGGLAGVEIFVFGVDVDVEYETATPSPDYEIGTGAWYSKIGGSWKEIYKMYYKVGNAWKEVAYAYRKQDNTWYSIGERKLLFEADFYNSLTYIDYLGNTTGNFSYNGTASYTNSMLNINNRGDNFIVSTAIPSSLKTYLINASNEVWFTIKAHVISWNDTGWRGATDNGWATSGLWARNGNIFNTFSINGPNYAGSASEPYVPANTLVWVKVHYYGNNYDEYFYSSSTWSPQHPTANTWSQIFGRSGSTSTLAYNANNLNYIGFGKGYINYRISDFKIWSSEPTNDEIGI